MSSAGPTNYFYDDNYRQVAVQDPLGNTTTTVYNAANQVVAVVDPLGNTTNFIYDGDGRQIAVVDARGNRTTTAFDPAGQVTSVTDGLNRTTQYLYDLDGRPTVVIDPIGNRTTTHYDADSRVTAVTDARQSSTITGYDAEGNVVTITDALSHTTTFAYDAAGQRTLAIDAAGRRVTTGYDKAGEVTSVTDGLGTTTYLYDADGRRTDEIDYLRNRTVTIYDAAGQVIEIVKPDGLSSTFGYDAAGRLVRQTDWFGNTSSTVYDAAGEAVVDIDPLGHLTSHLYDLAGRETTTIDALGKRTTMVYDGDGRLVNLIDADNNKTTFAYDAVGNKTLMTDPLGHTATFQYDAANQLTDTTDRLGQRVTYSYDADGRETGEHWFANAILVSYTYDAVGNMLTASNNNGTYTMAYDAENRMTQVVEPIGPTGLTLTFSYDNVGNRTQVQDGTGTENSTYDARDRLTYRSYTKNGDANPSAHVELVYDGLDEILTERRYAGGASPPLVATTNYTYDDSGRITNEQHVNSTGGNLDNFTYTYDAAGNLQTEVRNGITTTYTYDADNQVLTDGVNTLTYDANGNRTNGGSTVTTGNQISTDGTYNYLYDANGNVTKKTNISTGDYWTYGYDQRNELTSAVDKTSGNVVELTATYKYDAFGNRIEKDVTTTGTVTTKFAMDGWNPDKPPGMGNDNWDVLFDINGSGSLTNRYMQGDGTDQNFGALAYNGSSFTPNWYLTDVRGSVRNIVNNSATSLDTISYDSSGKITSQSNSANLGRYAYIGREFDVETNLQYNRARYYDPSTGRWMSQDPLGFDAGDSNLYRYAYNQPTGGSDPSGFSDPTNADLGLPGNTQLPSRNGLDWSGPIGNSDFVPRNPGDFGLRPGERVPFVNGRPQWAQWVTPVPTSDRTGTEPTFEVPEMGTGSRARHGPDRTAMLEELARRRLENVDQTKAYLSQNDLILDHAGGNRAQLVEGRVHRGVHHTGGRSDNARLGLGGGGWLGGAVRIIGGFLLFAAADYYVNSLPPGPGRVTAQAYLDLAGFAFAPELAPMQILIYGVRFANALE
jgi:RHS repeat-associated protein